MQDDSPVTVSYSMKLALCVMELICVGQIVFVSYFFLIENSFDLGSDGLSLFSVLIGLFLVCLIVLVVLIPYGFLNRKQWIQSVLLLLFVFSILMNILFMLVVSEALYIWYPFFVGFFGATMFVMMSPVSEFLSASIEKKEECVEDAELSDYLQIGEYILHKQQVMRRNGTMGTLYYFCKGSSDKGVPCNQPDQYELNFNKRTNVPYLKKKPTLSE